MQHQQLLMTAINISWEFQAYSNFIFTALTETYILYDSEVWLFPVYINHLLDEMVIRQESLQPNCIVTKQVLPACNSSPWIVSRPLLT